MTAPDISRETIESLAARLDDGGIGLGALVATKLRALLDALDAAEARITRAEAERDAARQGIHEASALMAKLDRQIEASQAAVEQAHASLAAAVAAEREACAALLDCEAAHIQRAADSCAGAHAGYMLDADAEIVRGLASRIRARGEVTP